MDFELGEGGGDRATLVSVDRQRKIAADAFRDRLAVTGTMAG